MRIGMVTACYKPVINGVTQMVSLYKQVLEQLGHEVTVFTLGKPDPHGDEAGVVRSPGLPLGQTGYYFGIRYTQEAQSRLMQMEVLHCHHLLMSVEMAHRYAHAPIVYTNHTRYDLYAAAYSHLPLSTTNLLLRRVWPALANLGDVVIAPSHGAKQVLQAYGIRAPIEVIANGIELERFLTPSRPHTKQELGLSGSALLLVFVGRLAREKNLDVLLEQFGQVRDAAAGTGREVHLLLIGDGPLRRTIPTWREQRGLTGAVHLLGAVSYEETANWLAAADLFITASISEIHPLTLIEAMAAGLPVVAVHSPGISDTVQPGLTGLLADRPDQLAETAMPLVIDESCRQAMGAAARIASQQFDIRQTVAHTLALYERLLAGQNERPSKRKINLWQ